MTFAGKGILLGYMATKLARKIEQVMTMILGRIMNDEWFLSMCN